MAMHTWTIEDIPEQTGKLVVVTGANSGLGYQTAWALAGKGARVVLAVRDEEKGRAVAAAIQQAYPWAQLEVMALPFLGAAVLVGTEWLRTDVAAAGIRDDGVGPARDAQIEAAALDRREAEMSGRRQNAQALRHGDLRIIRNSARVGTELAGVDRIDS